VAWWLASGDAHVGPMIVKSGITAGKASAPCLEMMPGARASVTSVLATRVLASIHLAVVPTDPPAHTHQAG